MYVCYGHLSKQQQACIQIVQNKMTHYSINFTKVAHSSMEHFHSLQSQMPGLNKAGMNVTKQYLSTIDYLKKVGMCK